MSTIGFWFKNARNIALPQSVLPCLTAIILCIGQEGFLWWLALPVLLGVCAAHLGMNLADDYFDYKHDSRTRADISSTSVRARMEKCHYLGEGKATVRQLGWAIVGFLAFAAVMGVITALIGNGIAPALKALLMKKPYSMYENKIVRDYRDGKVTKEELDRCSTCESCGKVKSTI